MPRQLKLFRLLNITPTECIKTNINGAMNVIDACNESGVQSAVVLSTDKASNPINLYGATKLASDKLPLASNPINGRSRDAFFCCPLWQCHGSRGSVIPFFLSRKETGELPITDTAMTRFMISLEEGVKLVRHAFDDMYGGEIYVKKIQSMTVVDIAKTVALKQATRLLVFGPVDNLMPANDWDRRCGSHI